MFNPIFNYCIGNIKNPLTAGFVDANSFLSSIKEPKPEMQTLIDRIRVTTDENVKNNLKTKLPSVTPAVLFAKGSSRAYKNIQKFTGLMMLDFDKIDFADQFRDYLFYYYDYVLATWLSSSGRGVRAIVRVPISQSTDEFKQRFDAVFKVFNVYDGFDTAPKNSVLPLFYSIDRDINFDLNRTSIFEGIEPKKVVEKIPTDWIKPSSIKGKWAVSNTKKAIDKITDNGHPQLRAAAYSLGGYVGAGYLGEGEAIDLIECLIDGNNYLSQKPAVYKTTAKTMIKKGQNQPLNM